MDLPCTSAGHLLGGRLDYAQPVHGFRTGIEPVFLAAAIPARPGQRVLEAGTGAGAALLCLSHRLPALALVGVERDPAMAALARCNIAANSLASPPTIITADITADPDLGQFDHACANPPWHEGGGTKSPLPAREAAKRRRPELLAQWTSALARRLRPRGTLTLILPAAIMAEGISVLTAAGFGDVALFPLWPKPGARARVILLQAIRGGRGPDRVLAGLVLHTPDGGYTAAAEDVLREGAPLTLGRSRIPTAVDTHPPSALPTRERAGEGE